MSHELLILLPVSFIAGAINAAVGGGGLIGIPALYNVLTTYTPAQIMGVDKFSSVMGHAMSIRQYATRIPLPWRLILPTAVTAFLGSYLGVRMLDLMPSHWMRPIILIVLAAMLVYTWLRPEFGRQDTSRAPTRADLFKGAALGMALGFYDGFIGPGTGSFLLFLFVRFFHFDFLRASACAKVGSSIAAPTPPRWSSWCRRAWSITSLPCRWAWLRSWGPSSVRSWPCAVATSGSAACSSRWRSSCWPNWAGRACARPWGFKATRMPFLPAMQSACRTRLSVCSFMPCDLRRQAA
nr:sulfite exporter TauE/SafE family protein [Candidatus Dactylopiibacterium carminicum]